jgi:phosphatidylglycerophosphate synthase
LIRPEAGVSALPTLSDAAFLSPCLYQTGGSMDRIVSVVLFIVLIICLLAWAVIGLFFWVPLLFRETAMFSVRVMHASITSQSIRNSSQGLQLAASFYINGFLTAINAVGLNASTSNERARLRLFVLLFESLWAAVTWVAILAVAGHPLGDRILSQAKNAIGQLIAIVLR